MVDQDLLHSLDALGFLTASPVLMQAVVDSALVGQMAAVLDESSRHESLAHWPLAPIKVGGRVCASVLANICIQADCTCLLPEVCACCSREPYTARA